MPQKRFYFRVMIAVAVVLTMGITLANGFGRAFGDPDILEIKTFFHPIGCPRPCWLGIRPGVTTLSEALQILKESPWIGRVYEAGLTDPDGPPHIVWEWSIHAPYFVDRHALGEAIILNDVVAQIELRPNLTFGEVQSALGLPSRTEVDDIKVSWHAIMEFNRYDHDTLTFESWYTCPVTHAKHFNAFVKATITTTGFSRQLGFLPTPCQ